MCQRKQLAFVLTSGELYDRGELADERELVGDQILGKNQNQHHKQQQQKTLCHFYTLLIKQLFSHYLFIITSSFPPQQKKKRSTLIIIVCSCTLAACGSSPQAHSISGFCTFPLVIWLTSNSESLLGGEGKKRCPILAQVREEEEEGMNI